jgi:hypothetical protein
MFIDHTILFGCMAWWVRTRVLTLAWVFYAMAVTAEYWAWASSFGKRE